MKFNFIGKLQFNDANSERPFVRKGTTKNGAKYLSLNGSVVEQTNNRAFIESFGIVYDSIKTTDTDGESIEIKWSDRKDKDVIENVANYRKHIIKMNEERYEFITEYDFIDFILNNVEEIKEKKWQITGRTQLNIYEGNISRRFIIQNMYEVNEDTKNKLKCNDVVYFTKDDIDIDDWNSEKRITVNGYTKEYVDRDNPNKYVPFQFILDASKINFENEKHINILNFKLSMIGLKYEDGKIVNKLKKSVYCTPAIFNYVNGAEEVELSMDDLTDKQKELVELGVKELKDFVEGSVYGNRVTVYKVVDFDLRTVNKIDFTEGIVELDETIDEFNDDIYAQREEINIEDVLNEQDNDDDDELFS